MESERTERVKTDGLEAFRKWLTPFLILVIGYLIGNKLSEIDEKMKIITAVQTAQAVMKVEVDNIKDKQRELENDFLEHKRESNEPLYQEAEKNIKRKIR